jgi:hypothetical protein
MRTVSAAWRPLVEAYRQGLGVEEFLAVLIPSRNLVLTGRPWPDGWLPAGMLVYPHLAPMGQGLGAISVELADDRSSRLGTVACEVRVQAGQIGAPLSPLQQMLLTLGEQPALVWVAFRGGAVQEHQQILPVFSGRIQAPRLARGVLTFTIVDGSAQDHRDIEVPLGTSLFPGAPLDAHGLTIPLVIGTALGVAPTLVSSVAHGTLATPLPAAAVETVNLQETGANFPEAGAIVVGGETITYSGRRVGLLLDGASTLQLLAPVRSAPVAHPAGEAVTLAPPIVYRYLIGLGLTPLELLAVRDVNGVIATYTFVPNTPGSPEGTATLELSEVHEDVQVDVQVIPEPPLPPLINGGFETGGLAPWAALPGTTAFVVLQDTQAGAYKLQFQEVGTTLQGVTQDVAVVVGERYVLLFNWRTPIQMLDNLLTNGDFRIPPFAFPPDPELPLPEPDPEYGWEYPEAEGMKHAEIDYEPPVPVPDEPELPPDPEYPPDPPTASTVNAQGAQVFTLPIAPLYKDVEEPTSAFGYEAAGYASYRVAMEQSLTLSAGQPVALDVRVSAFVQSAPTGSTVTYAAVGAGGVTLGSLPPLSEVTVEAQLWPGSAGGQPVYQRYLQPDQAPTPSGRQAEFQLHGTFTPTGTSYRFVIAISGRYIGKIPPIVVTTAVVAVA